MGWKFQQEIPTTILNKFWIHLWSFSAALWCCCTLQCSLTREFGRMGDCWRAQGVATMGSNLDAACYWVDLSEFATLQLSHIMPRYPKAAGEGLKWATLAWKKHYKGGWSFCSFQPLLARPSCILDDINFLRWSHSMCQRRLIELIIASSTIMESCLFPET